MAALEKMSGHPRLYRRESTYYHRAAIPRDIADTYPKSEETFSLRTKDHAEAIRRVRVAAVEVDQRFEDHRRWLERSSEAPLGELTPDQIRLVSDTYYRHLMEEDDELRTDGFAGFTAAKSFNEFVELNEAETASTRISYARGEAGDFHWDEAEEVLSWDGINIRLKDDSSSWPRLVRALQEASIKAGEDIQKRNSGEIVETPQEPDTASPAPSSSPLLSELFLSRRAEAERTQNWSPKLVDDYNAWTDLFIELIGDRPILDYKKPDAREFKERLMELPSNRHKVKATQGMNAREAIEAAKRGGLKLLTVSTINKALGRMQATWKWADEQLDDEVKDIFGPMKLDSMQSARDQKDPFDTEELNKIFHSPLYTGCLSERRRAVRGETNMSHTHWYWLPLLGLFTGARLNELCQLSVEDVGEDGGIPYLMLREADDTQRIKGRRGRIVPLHPELIRLGFLRYIATQNDTGEARVFPALRLGKKGYYSERPSKGFNAYLGKIGAKTDKTSFLSFRHNFKDVCRDCGVASDIADLLQGHSLSGMAGRYGSGRVLLERLHGELCKVEFRGLDLNHIKGFSLK